MKVGIVVPYSWSFWGAVVEHAELQADALERLGVQTRTIIGHDPPGRFTSALHPRHGPMTPAICTAVLALARIPMVATFHASGNLGWMRVAKPTWGFLADRLDHRIAVSEQARESQRRWLPGEYEIIPNGVLIPPQADAGEREHRLVFAGRQEPRKGLQILLRAWPEIREW